MSTIWIDSDARRKITAEAQRFRFVETGGPLFGFGDDEALVIVAAGGPGARARHRPLSFVPDRKAVARAIDHVWEVGEQRYRYLGSWHTHPRGRAVPSGRDRATAREMSRDEGLNLPRPLILIQSTWPGRRVIRDIDLRAYRAAVDSEDLVSAQLLPLPDDEREWEPIDLA